MPTHAPDDKDTHATRHGALYLVATPIGNLEDISLRALRILKEVDLIACEDTRQTKKLLSRYDIHKPLESYHEHNEAGRAAELLGKLKSGQKIALVSDAGTPLLSDPGHRLVSICAENGIPVVPIPGPSALTTALVGSGMDISQFVFIGFLPARSGERRRELQTLAANPRTLVFYEAPHRLALMLEDAREILGDREAVIARELTKMHEEFRRGRLSELENELRSRAPRGEITVIIGAAKGPSEGALIGGNDGSSASVALPDRIQQVMDLQKLDQKAALKQVARERGLNKREAYKQLLAARGKN
jgi:16S rRNA (cytidine1402-2'-O)-methyltransferase